MPDKVMLNEFEQKLGDLFTSADKDNLMQLWEKIRTEIEWCDDYTKIEIDRQFVYECDPNYSVENYSFGVRTGDKAEGNFVNEFGFDLSPNNILRWRYMNISDHND